MASRSPKRIRDPLDMQRVRRVMGNKLSEGVSQNRLRAANTPKSTLDPEKASVLGKTLGELQDYRDLAHDESLKTEQIAREAATEKRSIRDRIAEIKAKIEYKKHLLEKTSTENKALGKQSRSRAQLEGVSKKNTRIIATKLLDDAKQQLEEAYTLRDKILGASTGAPTVAPQVKYNIEKRMGDLEGMLEKDIEEHHKKAASLEANLDQASKQMASSQARTDEVKHEIKEAKHECELLDKDVEREIDSRTAEINDNNRQLKQVLKEKQELKWKIGSLEHEVNNLEFQKNRLELEYDVRNLKENKGDIMQQLTRRIEDAKYNERHIKDMCSHAEVIDIDIGFIERIDSEGDRAYRLRQLRDDLEYKKREEKNLKEEVRRLNSQLNTLGEVNMESSTFMYEENYTHQLKDLQIGYNDIVQSMKDHLAANSAILRKEKEIKEMEARIALIDLEALDEEYNKLRIMYDRDSEILRDLEERYSLIHDRLIRLRARLRELNDLIRTLEERLETARFEIEDAERKYKLIKIPKKIEYVVNERVEDVLIRKKYLTGGRKISEKEYERERRSRSTHGRVTGKTYYIPSQTELNQLVPLGTKVRIKPAEDGWFYYGKRKFYFIKGNDGEMWVHHDGDEMTFDDFITYYELQERQTGRTQDASVVEYDDIDDEINNCEVGEETDGVGVMDRGMHYFQR